MSIATQKNIIIGCLVIFSIIMYDLLLDVLDSILWCIQIVFELIELTIERLLLRNFKLTHHESEIYTAYGMLFVGLIILYHLWQFVPGLFRRLKRNLLAAWLRQKRRSSLYWRHLPLINKVKMAAMCTTGFTGLLLLI